MNFIEKHHIEISCAKQSTAKHIQHEIGYVFEQTLYPKLDELLSRYDVSDHVWQVETLEVSIPNLTMSNWKHNLISAILEQVEVFFAANQKQKVNEKTTSNNHKIVSKDFLYQQLLLQYLTEGKLSLNTSTDRLSHIMNVVKVDEQFSDALFNAIEQDSELLHNVVLRLVLNLPHQLQRALADTLNVTKDIDGLRAILKQGPKSLEPFALYLLWITIINSSGPNCNTKTLTDAILKSAHTYFSISEPELIKHIEIWQTRIHSKTFKNKVIFKGFQKTLVSIASKVAGVNTNTKQKNDDTSLKNATNTDIESILEALQGYSHNESQDDTSYMYIKNSGIVILSPFLVPLFERLGYLEASQWKDEVLQHRAILLMHYLVYGTAEIFENELVLNKILCGVAVATAVKTDWDITKEEKVQCQELLESVITHWSILKDTSVATLRDTFLQRNAKLTEYKEAQYELIVEHQSVDILLDHLPWGIGTIKTPWMKHFLTCQWL
ncbi:contractile injection system tape measure protein [Winogradskyella sp.]|uniref:contractile injection system tape measure protein n=1 Tax=Winogradskyella sp. TaxID=1883156 RepID=UPI003BAAA4EB